MIRTILRACVIVFLCTMLVSLAFKFLKLALGLALLAIPIVLFWFVLKAVWAYDSREGGEVAGNDYFTERFPRLARLERHLKALERATLERPTRTGE